MKQYGSLANVLVAVLPLTVAFVACADVSPPGDHESTSVFADSGQAHTCNFPEQHMSYGNSVSSYEEATILAEDTCIEQCDSHVANIDSVKSWCEQTDPNGVCSAMTAQAFCTCVCNEPDYDLPCYSPLDCPLSLNCGADGRCHPPDEPLPEPPPVS
jgi:hypothetical protein